MEGIAVYNAAGDGTQLSLIKRGDCLSVRVSTLDGKEICLLLDDISVAQLRSLLG